MVIFNFTRNMFAVIHCSFFFRSCFCVQNHPINVYELCHTYVYADALTCYFFFLFADSFAKVIWLKCFHTRNCNKLSDKLQREKNSISSETFYELFFVFSSFSMWISIIARMCDVNDEVVHMKAIIASCWLFIYLPFQLVITTFMLSTRGMNKFKAVLFWSLCFLIADLDSGGRIFRVMNCQPENKGFNFLD